ncbi:hypothetical protein NC651_015035 [Populus alba x Populus x berolinensis]|nr:hypothetical protein NC651_015035 [Populus alba x Populus x berolinensis]
MFFPQRQVSLNIAFMTAKNYVHQDQLNTPNSTHAIFTFIVPVLLCFLEFMYQGKDYSPFDTHPITMWIGLTCVIAYCVVYGVEISCVKYFKSPVYASAARGGAMLFGSLSVASLASILFPDCMQPILYLLCTLFSLWELLYSTIWNTMEIESTQRRSVRHTSADARWLVWNSSDQRYRLPL